MLWVLLEGKEVCQYMSSRYLQSKRGDVGDTFKELICPHVNSPLTPILEADGVLEV